MKDALELAGRLEARAKRLDEDGTQLRAFYGDAVTGVASLTADLREAAAALRALQEEWDELQSRFDQLHAAKDIHAEKRHEAEATIAKQAQEIAALREREAGLRANLDRIGAYVGWIDCAVKRGAIPPPGDASSLAQGETT